MGKKRVIAETGAGQHGVATATAAALFGLKCDVYMGAEDIRRQNLNVFRMKLMGANVIEVTAAARRSRTRPTKRCATGWAASSTRTTSSARVVGPHPFPMIVRDFQAMIGSETQRAVPAKSKAGCPTTSSPASAAARTRPASSHPFVERHIGETDRRRSRRPRHRARPARRHAHARASPACCTARSATSCRTTTAKPPTSTAVSRRPRLSRRRPRTRLLEGSGRVEYVSITDAEALEAFQLLAQLEGILPALETAHAIAQAAKLAPNCRRDKIVVINLSGRGDKDCQEVARLLGK